MNSSMALPHGRIPENAFKIVTGIAFGLAMAAAVTRAAIRISMRRRPGLDDFFLLFACSCLIASTVLLYWGLNYIFFAEAVTLSGTSSSPSAASALNYSEINSIISQLIIFQKVNWAYLAVNWTVIFSVKAAFLAFFRTLVNQLPRLLLYWRVLCVFTALVFCVAVCDAFIACPKLGLDSLSCSQGDGLTRALAMGSTAISLDIITDCLILVIPTSLLWKVQIRARQKLGLAAFLCLSVFMIVMAAIRISGFHYRGGFDNTWIFFWQEIESCVAVAMISATAFRSAFVADGSRPAHARGPRSPASPGSSTRKPSISFTFVSQTLRKISHTLSLRSRFSSNNSSESTKHGGNNSKHSFEKNQHESDPDLANVAIPRATMTGVRTALGRDVTLASGGTRATDEETLVGDLRGDRWARKRSEEAESDGRSSDDKGFSSEEDEKAFVSPV